MKKTIKYMIIGILLIGVVTAFNPFNNLESALEVSYDNVSVIGNSTKYQVISNHSATDVIINGKNYTIFMAESDYNGAVIVSYLFEARLATLEREVNRLTNRIQSIEDTLNITDTTVVELPLSETQLYSCTTKESKECLGGLSGLNKNNISTRCYNIFKLGWSTCSSSGWELI